MARTLENGDENKNLRFGCRGLFDVRMRAATTARTCIARTRLGSSPRQLITGLESGFAPHVRDSRVTWGDSSTASHRNPGAAGLLDHERMRCRRGREAAS